MAEEPIIPVETPVTTETNDGGKFQIDDDPLFEAQYQRDKLQSELKAITDDPTYKDILALKNHLQQHPELIPQVQAMLQGKRIASPESEGGEPDTLKQLMEDMARIKAEMQKRDLQSNENREAATFMEEYKTLAVRYPVMNQPVFKKAVYYEYGNGSDTLLSVVKKVAAEMGKSPMGGKTLRTKAIEKTEKVIPISGGTGTQGEPVAGRKSLMELLSDAGKRQG